MRSFSSDREKHRDYNSLSEEQKYEAFCDILFDSEHVVFLGGAGVSTESGIPDFRSKNVQEIHGTIWKNHCVSCGERFDENFVFDSPDPVPHCPKCGKIVRPDVTLYGEYLPQPAYSNAIDIIGSADCLIIGGTSLEVGSAAQLAHMFHGNHLVIINKGKTRMEGAADLVFHDSISKVLEKIR